MLRKGYVLKAKQDFAFYGAAGKRVRYLHQAMVYETYHDAVVEAQRRRGEYVPIEVLLHCKEDRTIDIELVRADDDTSS